MICPNCGEKADAAAKFCSKCGQALEMESVKATHDGILNGRIVSLAVHLKVGIIKREPWVLWIGPQQCAFICIGQKRYDVIVSTGTQGAGIFRRTKPRPPGRLSAAMHRAWLRTVLKLSFRRTLEAWHSVLNRSSTCRLSPHTILSCTHTMTMNGLFWSCRKTSIVALSSVIRIFLE